MEAHKRFQVVCLLEEQAWELFREKVGEETLNSHPDILQLAQTVAKECDGLPLALITIGRAMAYKKTPEEWNYAITELRRAASEFAGLGKEVYPRLKFSYDSLPNDAIRSCFLYCCLYPEDDYISKMDLIDCWICEGFLEESDWFGAERQGYYILGTLVHACLLEEVGDYTVKMHDVIRDMALWITCEIEMEKENFLVRAGVGLTEAPDVSGWRNVSRLSLMQNQIENLSEVPTCPRLLTLFLEDNKLERITDGFFEFMSSLKVLNMSRNTSLLYLPLGISKLVSLQLLNLSNTCIKELPQELKALVNLKCLNLDGTRNLITIPRQLLSNFSRLRVLRMIFTSYLGGVLAEELHSLKYLEVLDISLRSMHAFEICLSSRKLRGCIQSLLFEDFEDSKYIDVSTLADLKHLNKLFFFYCRGLEEMKMDYIGELQKTPQPYIFNSLRYVNVSGCSMLIDLTFLVFAPNLGSLVVHDCAAMEEIISVGKFVEIHEMMGNPNPFAKLQHLYLKSLPNLKSIYRKPLSFTHLKKMTVLKCDELKKLPLDSNSANGHRIAIQGNKKWWEELQWEDEATQNAFLPCFKSLGF